MRGFRKVRLALALAVLPVALSCGGGGGGGGGGFNIVPSSFTMYVGKAVRFTAEGVQDGVVVEWSLSPPSAGTIIPISNTQCKVVAGANTGGAILTATVQGSSLSDTSTINLVTLAYAAAFPIVNVGSNSHNVNGDMDFGNGRVYVAHNNDQVGNFIYRFIVNPANPGDPPEASYNVSQSSFPPQPQVRELAASSDGSVYYVTDTGLLRRLLSDFSGNDPAFNPIVASYSGPVAVDASGIIHAATSGGLVQKMTSNGTDAGNFVLPVGFNPTSMSFDEDGSIVMGGGTQLRKFLPNGAEDPNFNVSGVTFTNIIDVDTDSEGGIYVVDDASPDRIVQMNAAGIFIQAYTSVETPNAVGSDFLGTLWIYDDTDEATVPTFTISSAIKKLTPL